MHLKGISLALPAVLFLLLTACGSEGQQAVEVTRVAPVQLPPGVEAPAGQPGTFPHFPDGSELYSTGHQTLNSNVATLAGSEYTDASEQAEIPEGTDHCLIDAADGMCWVLYVFTGATQDMDQLMLSAELVDQLPDVLWLGYSDFGQDRWHWEQIFNPESQVNLGIPAAVEPVSEQGEVYLVLLVDNANHTEIAEVRLDMDADSPPPIWQAATVATYPNLIRIDWVDPGQTYPGILYDSIQVERSFLPEGPFTSIAEVPSGLLLYADVNSYANQLPYDQPVYYRLRTTYKGKSGVPGTIRSGRRCLSVVPAFSATDDREAYSDYLGDHIELSWDPVEGASGYKIDYLALGGANPTEWTALADLSGGSQTSFSHSYDNPPDKSSSQNQEYSYRIVAFDYEGNIGPSGYQPIGYRQMKPTHIVSASKGVFDDRVQVSWEKVNAATGYRIYRDQVDEQHILAELGNVLSYEDTTAADYKLHSYWVAGKIAGDTGAVNVDYGFCAREWKGYNTGIWEFVGSSYFATLDAHSENGVPAVLAKTGYPDKLFYCYGRTPLPKEVQDWKISELPAELYGTGAMAMPGPLPVVVVANPIFSSNGVDYQPLYLAQAQLTSGGGYGWLVSKIVDIPLEGESPSSKALEVGIVAGKLAVAFAYKNSGHSAYQHAWYIGANTELPNSTEDWLATELLRNGRKPEFTKISALLDAGGVALVGLNSFCFVAGEPLPDSSADWVSYYLPRVSSFVRSGDEIYVIDNGTVRHTAVLPPYSDSDWQSYAFSLVGRGSMYGVELTPMDGRLGLWGEVDWGNSPYWGDNGGSGEILAISEGLEPQSAAEWSAEMIDNNPVLIPVSGESGGAPWGFGLTQNGQGGDWIFRPWD